MNDRLKKIIYIASHRGTKEMDMMLSNYIKTNISNINNFELLESLLCESDEYIYDLIINKKSSKYDEIIKDIIQQY
jgi:succinate dehydrogenase flavin-adding protein (antitoxin of CptAB toxin-antitoxin module)